MNEFVLIYFIFVNTLLFILMGIDKKRALKNSYRIREKTLFSLGVLGGFAGGLAGMAFFRHKTKKAAFYLVYGLSACFYAGLFVCLIQFAIINA